MEATKNITAKEREFIAAVEAHRNAEGKVIAWDICVNGNGKVIFENATKDRYSCAHVIDMEGGYFLLFVGERAGHPYDRKTYKRKGNALKGFRMQEGHNEPPTFAATPVETPQISTETAETANVSVEGGNTAERKEIEVQTIADMVAIGESLNKGESVSFKLHLHFLWSVTITNESAEWCEEFKYSLNAKCLDNPQSFGRRYTSFGLAMLHCLNRFNENANIRDDYETLSAALNKPQNLISDFRAPQSPETPQTVNYTTDTAKLAQTA